MKNNLKNSPSPMMRKLHRLLKDIPSEDIFSYLMNREDFCVYGVNKEYVGDFLHLLMEKDSRFSSIKNEEEFLSSAMERIREYSCEHGIQDFVIQNILEALAIKTMEEERK